MRTGICFTLTTSDRNRLQALITDGNTAQKHVWRARIVLLSAAGHGTHAIMREAGVAKTVVWRWQERFAQEGVDVLLRDKTRPARIPPLGPEVSERVVALPQNEPPDEANHWTAAAMAQAAGISVASVQRIWRGHGLQPHRVRTFKRSNDPAFASKLRDVVGPYVDPPAHAVVLSVDEKSPIQALSRTHRRLRRGVFGSLVEVQAAIKRFIAQTNGDPHPFVWTADPDHIIKAAKRRHQPLDSPH